MNILLSIIGGSGPQVSFGWAFWIVMLLALVYGFWWPREQPYYRLFLGYHVLGWLAILILGCAEFGVPGIGR